MSSAATGGRWSAHTPPPRRLPGLLLVGALTVVLLGWAGGERPLQGAEYGPDRPDTTIRFPSFATLRWGASRQQVRDRFGDPDDVDIMDRRLSNLPYPGWRGHKYVYEDVVVRGETADMVLYMHPTKGLRKGEYRFRFGPDRDCVELFERLEAALRDQHPNIEPVRRRKDPASYLSYCKGVRIGAAERHVWWKDPNSPALLHLALERNTDYVLLELQGPEWVWWRGTGFEDAILERHERR